MSFTFRCTLGLNIILNIMFCISSHIVATSRETCTSSRESTLFMTNSNLRLYFFKFVYGSFMLEAMNEVLWWSRCWRKLSTVDVYFRRWKLHCGPWTEVVLNATPPHLVKVKINFDEAQKLTWKEIKCLYGLLQINISSHISELPYMQLESRNRSVHKQWPRRRASKAAILVSRAFAFVFSRYKVINAPSLCFSSGAL